MNGNYWIFPIGSDSVPNNGLVSPDPGNNANFFKYDFAVGLPYYTTEVGEFENSESPYGTFDQGGNEWEWNETLISGSYCGVRGGSFPNYFTSLHAADLHPYTSPTHKSYRPGFRVASIPEPSTLLLGAMAAVGLLIRRRPLR